MLHYSYPKIIHKFNNNIDNAVDNDNEEIEFMLEINEGKFKEGDVVVLLGGNNTGKTTFMRILSGIIKPTICESEIKKTISCYKPQIFTTSYNGTVNELFDKKMNGKHLHEDYRDNFILPLINKNMFSKKVKDLKKDELQMVAIILTLGTESDIYLIDEPSRYLNYEQRIQISKVIKQFSIFSKKIIFVVEHDLSMLRQFADYIIIFKGEPGICCKALEPLTFEKGINLFIDSLEI
jgi:ATP-binding cassette, sub-family E, member 1